MKKLETHYQARLNPFRRCTFGNYFLIFGLVIALTIVGPVQGFAQDDQFAVTVAQITAPSFPFNDPGYTADGSFTINVTDGPSCPGTYAVNAAPVAGSGPGGSTPPLTTITTYIGFPQGNFFFGNAGVGDYLVTVTETSGCALEENPVQITVTIPDGEYDEPFTASATNIIGTTYTYPHPMYTNDGSFTISVIGTGKSNK